MRQLKNLHKKAKVGHKVLREQGVLGLGIVTLQFIQKKTNSKRRTRHGIYTKAKYDEVLVTDFSKPPTHWPGTTKKQLTINWLMPPPGKGSGGHMTLFRFIKYLEEAGHTCRIYLHNPGPGSTIAAVQAIMGDSFPAVKADMTWLQEGEEMAPADAIFATSWETAYSVYNAKISARRFYFVQDFEPYFFPVGSLSILAENTYKMGLYGITAGGWLAKKLHSDYGMQTDHFNFGSDGAIYSYENAGERKEIMFYARPYTERRGFELGIMALDLFHREHPDYTINFVGWDVSDYEIPFPYQNLKILEHHELNELYNRCAAGLVLSLTNMSLLPLELLSSGCIAVVNDADNNRLVSDNAFLAYSANDPRSLADTLSQIVTRRDAAAHAKRAADSVQQANWDESGKKFVSIVERETRKAT